MKPLPKLIPSNRNREFFDRSFKEVSKLVHAWLFSNDYTYRAMDKEILEKDPNETRGFQSMNTLHHLGLKQEFKGFFLDTSINDAIYILKKNIQNFDPIIELLQYVLDGNDDKIHDELLIIGKSEDKNFEQHFKQRLEEIVETDGSVSISQSRKEQGILRGILFKDNEEKECAFCHRILPTKIMVAAHIKPRSKCSASERKNPNIVMPVCKIGCDDFFEKGYLIVNNTGQIGLNSLVNYSLDLKQTLSIYNGKNCTYFNEKTKIFFKYKRDIINSKKKSLKKD